MKKLKRIPFIVLLTIITFFLFDIYACRFYFSNSLITYYYKESTAEHTCLENKNLDFNITFKENTYTLTFKNNTLKPHLIWTYRGNRVFFPVNDSIFSYLYRLNVKTAKNKDDYDFSFGCGAEATPFSINPYESFSYKISSENFLKRIRSHWNFRQFYYQKNDTIMDLIYNKPILIEDRENNRKIFNRNDITNKDSISIELYLPVYSYDYKEHINIKSNSIKLPYKTIINQLIAYKS